MCLITRTAQSMKANFTKTSAKGGASNFITRVELMKENSGWMKSMDAGI